MSGCSKIVPFDNWYLVSICHWRCSERQMIQILCVSLVKLWNFTVVRSKLCAGLRTSTCEGRQRHFNKSHTRGGVGGGGRENKTRDKRRDAGMNDSSWKTNKETFFCVVEKKRQKECCLPLYLLILVILDVVLRRVTLLLCLRAPYSPRPSSLALHYSTHELLCKN